MDGKNDKKVREIRNKLNKEDFNINFRKSGLFNYEVRDDFNIANRDEENDDF